MIELKNVSKTLSGERIFENVSLRVGNGECAVILSESDEQTILLSSLIVGAIEVSEGAVLINGYNLSKQKSKVANQIGFVPAEGALYEDMTAREFLFFVAEAKSIPYERTSAKVGEVLAFCDLEVSADRLVASLSHSARRRLLLAQSILGTPSALVLCEPFEGLDASSKKIVSNVILNFLEQGTSIVALCREDNFNTEIERTLYMLDGTSLCAAQREEKEDECK